MAVGDPELEALRRRGSQLLASISEQLTLLLAREYPTDSPKQFVDYLRSIVKGLREILDATDSGGTAKYILRFTKDLGSHLRYLDAASYPRVPWALIGPMENLILKIVPGSQLVLRAQWQYNYKIIAISETYRRALSTLPPTPFGNLLEPSAPIWNIVSLPTIDRTNVLMHVILGHEAGHRVAERFLRAEDVAEVQREIITLVDDGTWYDRRVQSHNRTDALRVLTNAANYLLALRTRGLKELISDLVGVHLFGPSLLFGLRELSLESPLDTAPSAPLYYPPWRYRYRLALDDYRQRGYQRELEALATAGTVGRVRAAVLCHVSELETMTRERTDLDEIEANEGVKRAYGSIARALPNAREFIREQLTDLGYVPAEFRERMEQLVERIALGVPPAETDRGAVSFRDVIMAGWLYKLGRLHIPLEEIRGWNSEDDATLERLVHKAMEYSDIAEEYRAWRNQAEAAGGAG